MSRIEHNYTPEISNECIESIAPQLIGVWSLVSYTDEQAGREDIHPFGSNPKGFLIYTQDGFVSAQLMQPDRAIFHSSDWHQATPAEYEASGSGYIAYCGTYEVDEKKAMVTHIPSIALLPNLIGERQLRTVDLNGDRLTLRTAVTSVDNGLSVTSRLEWKRVQSNVQVV